MQSPWEVRVGRKAKVLAEFRVPAHKLQKNTLLAFLKAVVVRYRTESPKDMLAFYVNKTRGAPAPLSFAETKPCHDLAKRRVGYCCGDWECYALAMQEISAEAADGMKLIFEQNRRARLAPPGH
jgi:hypothetical protein